MTEPHDLGNSVDLNIRGDSIGDSAYSQRFVINVLMKLMTLETIENLSDFIEKDLCILWDMTSEKEVAKFLLKHNTLEIFCDVLKAEYDSRLTEVIIGTVANITTHHELVEEVNKVDSIRKCIYDYVSCEDSAVVIQVMRFIFSNVYCNRKNLDFWLKFLIDNKFVFSINYILNNSTNESLLSNTFETVNCVCSAAIEPLNKKYLKQLLFEENVVKASIIGFEELSKSLVDSGKYDALERCEIVFLSIHSILTSFESQSSLIYKDNLTKLLYIMNTILVKYTEANNEAIVDVVEYITTSLPVVHDETFKECINIRKNMMNLWKDTVSFKGKSLFDSKLSKTTYEALENILPQYLVRVFNNLPIEELTQLLSYLNNIELHSLVLKIDEMIKTKDMHSSFQNVSTAIKSVIPS